MPKDKPAFSLRGDLKQRDVTKLDLELAKLAGEYLVLRGMSSRMAAYLKAAIAAGWFLEPETVTRQVTEGKVARTEYLFGGVDVDEMAPNEAYRAGHAVSELYDSFTTLDPN